MSKVTITVDADTFTTVTTEAGKVITFNVDNCEYGFVQHSNYFDIELPEEVETLLAQDHHHLVWCYDEVNHNLLMAVGTEWNAALKKYHHNFIVENVRMGRMPGRINKGVIAAHMYGTEDFRTERFL